MMMIIIIMEEKKEFPSFCNSSSSFSAFAPSFHIHIFEANRELELNDAIVRE